MTTTNSDLTTRLLAWHDGLPWVNENASLMAAAIIELADGEPVHPERIAARAGRPAAEAIEFLHGSPAEWDDQGRLVGLGLTLRETPHRFTTRGRTLHTWCAPDALAFPVLLGAHAVIESRCFATGETVRIELGPDGVDHVEPANAVVSVVPRAVGLGDFRGRLCDEQHFFVSSAAAAAWRQTREDVLIVPVADAFDPLRRLMRRWAGTESEAA
jgi:alkylmercury lyase